MSWGFPAMVQNNSLTDIEHSFALATDFENASISFPTTTGGIINTAFPTISQISNQSQLMTQFKFMNQQQSMDFAYPWLSIGFSPVPSMGFL
jgi:hypothetical protein